jgi:DNA-binding HxlR family transcriptional regulator
MKKSNTEIIYDLLLVQPLRSGDIEKETSIPNTTLFRVLNTMISDKIIRKVDGLYSLITPTPSIEGMIDKMMMYHQQKLMDYKYRRLDRDKQIDLITEWFIDNPNNLKGKIDDYIFDDLLENITKATTQLKYSI